MNLDGTITGMIKLYCNNVDLDEMRRVVLKAIADANNENLTKVYTDINELILNLNKCLQGNNRYGIFYNLENLSQLWGNWNLAK